MRIVIFLAIVVAITLPLNALTLRTIFKLHPRGARGLFGFRSEFLSSTPQPLPLTIRTQ